MMYTEHGQQKIIHIRTNRKWQHSVTMYRAKGKKKKTIKKCNPPTTNGEQWMALWCKHKVQTLLV